MKQYPRTAAPNQEGPQPQTPSLGKLQARPRRSLPSADCRRPPTPLHRGAAPALHPRSAEAGGWPAAAWPARSPPPAPPPRVCGAGEGSRGHLARPEAQPRRPPRGRSGRAARAAPSLPGRRGAARQGGRESVRGTGPPRLPAQRGPGSRGPSRKPRPEEHSPPGTPRPRATLVTIKLQCVWKLPRPPSFIIRRTGRGLASLPAVSPGNLPLPDRLREPLFLASDAG